MDISEVRHALADAVRDPNVKGLNALGYTPDSVPEPCFYSGEVQINPNFTFKGDYEITVTCRVLVARSDDMEGQRRLDKYLSNEGDYSIIAALKAARGGPGELALDGAAHDLSVESIEGYRLYLVGEVEYYGAELRVKVIGP